MGGEAKTWSDEAILALRRHERHQEYRLRRMQLELAGAGIAPVNIDPRAPAFGAGELVASLAGFDLDVALEVVDAVHSKGFAIAPLVDGTTVRRLREGLDPWFERARSKGSSASVPDQRCHVGNLLEKTDVADEVAIQPTLRAVVAGCLGYDFTMNVGVMAMEPQAGAPPQNLHRDDSFFPLLPRPRMPLVVTVVIALDDFSEASGATRLVPGSCLWPEPREPTAEAVVHCEMPAGSMLVFDGGTYHGGGMNRSRARRRALTLNYTRGWLRAHSNHFLAVSRERVMGMPTILRRDLGYRPSSAGLGMCENADPEAYLMRLQAAGGDGHQQHLGVENG